jgi:hypothetical protein
MKTSMARGHLLSSPRQQLKVPSSRGTLIPTQGRNKTVDNDQIRQRVQGVDGVTTSAEEVEEAVGVEDHRCKLMYRLEHK